MQQTEEIKEFVRKGHHPQLNRVLVYQSGEVTANCFFHDFTEESRNVIKSIMKSILSVGIGIAIDKGLLPDVNARIYKYLPEFAEGREAMHRSILVKHLLTMSSGIAWNGGIHYHCPMLDSMRNSPDWVSYIADCAMTSRPGSRHNYSEFDVILLSAILSKVTGDTFDFLNQELFQPLKISSGRWYQSPCGVSYSIGMTEEDEVFSNLTAWELLQLGKLFLQDGVVDGNRIVSSEYIKQTITPSACDPGYGFLWWLGEDWYGCRGFGGQSVTVLPKKEAVIVTQATPTSRPIPYNDVIWFAASLL